jgi:cyclic pyranopterin phosphate synthase
MLRGGLSDDALRAAVAGIWNQRKDRYSEERGQVARPKAEMSYLGG